MNAKLESGFLVIFFGVGLVLNRLSPNMIDDCYFYQLDLRKSLVLIPEIEHVLFEKCILLVCQRSGLRQSQLQCALRDGATGRR